MNRKPNAPPWWQAVALVAGMMALLWFERVIPFPARGHQLIQLTIVGLLYALLLRWVHRHHAALRDEAEQRQREAVRRAHEERWSKPPLNDRQQHFREVVHRAASQEKEP